MLSTRIRPVAHKWIPVVGGVMMLFGLIICITGLDAPPILGFQQIILGAMLFGLGFLSCTMWALLSKIGQSESIPTHIASDINKLAHSQQTSGLQESEDKISKETKTNQANPTIPRRNTFCENCGAQLRASQKFCGKCGGSRN